jgi:thiosulfate dehydrogenase
MTTLLPARRRVSQMALVGLFACASPPARAPATSTTPTTTPAAPREIPAGSAGDEIRRGEALARHTNTLLPDHVGADLTCSNCHLGAGTVAGAGPWIGLSSAYPAYRDRSGRVDTLPDRINDCFERSVNGRPLPADGPEMGALVAYIDWLSAAVPEGTTPGRGFARFEPPSPADDARGAQVYTARCAACHQANGEGVVGADGAPAFPPLWGPRSFNIGAGMARVDTAAAFVRSNMPLGAGGSLTDQEAYDVAWWFTHQPRPDLPGKEKDWPNGGKPRDARY